MPRFAVLLCLSGLLAAAMLLAGCSSGLRTLPRQEPSPGTGTLPGSQPASLAGRIDRCLVDSLFPPANAAILVSRLSDTTLLYERNPDLLFTPASNQKLFTSAAAFGLLGPSYRIQTLAAVDPARRRIYLKGGGDPVLTTADLDSLARQVAAGLPRDSKWTLVGDVSRFDTLYWGPGWMWDDAAEADGMGVTPLTVNRNTVEVHARAGSLPGFPPVITVIPPTGYVKIENQAIVADSVRRELTVTRPLQHPSNTITVAGDLLPGEVSSATISVFEPDRYALALFAEALGRAGIRCESTLLDTLPRALPAAAAISHQLDTVVSFMNKVSDNLSAECLLKILGAEATGAPGTWRAGALAIKTFLASEGIDTTRIAVVDGSGLSRYNLTTAGTILRLLRAMARKPAVFPAFYSSLPAAGEEGTLSRRMRGTRAEHRLRAKTGTVGGVSSLSGYTTGAAGEMLAFSMLMQNFPGPSRPYRAVQDSIGILLTTWALP